MAAETIHHVTIRLAREYEFVAEFNDLPAAGPVMFDEPEPIGHSRAPSAADMLGAAVGNCLCTSLTFALREAQVELLGLTAQVTTHIVRNEKGHHRVGSIEVELSPAIGRTGQSLGAAGAAFEDFCAVTASVRHGIPVTVSMKPSPASIES
jgi:uncharacterized OsmC-like protein